MIPDSISLRFGKEIIKRTDYVKFFSILVDGELSWKFLISEPCIKLFRTCGLFLN